MGTYHWYAEAYQWPPEIVRKLSIKEDYWLRVQKDAMSAAQETLQEQALRESKLGGPRFNAVGSFFLRRCHV